MNIVKLRDIRGIGPSVEEKLLTYFGSEKLVLNALRSSHIAEISSIDGIGERFALSLCRSLHYQETGEQIKDFLKTEDTILLYNRIIDLIAKFGNTFFARSKLFLYFPLPITSLVKIQNRQKLTMKGQDLYNLIRKSFQSIDDYNIQLQKLSPLKEHSESIDTAARVIATTDQRISDELQRSELSRYCEILFIEDYEKINEILADQDEVIWIGNDYIVDDGLPNVISISETQRHEQNNIIPEKVLTFFAQNKPTLEALSSLVILLQKLPREKVTQFIGDLDLNAIEELGKLLKDLEETGEPSGKINEEFSRLLEAEISFESILDEILINLNEELEKTLQDTTIHLGGEKILSLLKGLTAEEQGFSSNSSSSDLREYLDDELYLAVEEIVNKSEQKLI
ncbi:MAG: hypothetical protein ACXAB2_13840, partial [Candidatus Hodarchaeales archaeon]